MDYHDFEAKILALTQIDLTLYKENQMKRRIDALINRVQRKHFSNTDIDYEEYLQKLCIDKDALKYFLDYITINVTEFFRHTPHWQYLEREVLSQMDNPHIWSVACSTGQEPYSLVMSLAEHMPLSHIHVLATDINERALAYALRGIYTAEEMQQVDEARKARFFVPSGSGFRICDEVKKCVEFRKMNLLADTFPTNQDLIVCRNILIYFTAETKQWLYPAFHDALKPGGILFTGHTEQIITFKEIGFQKLTNYLYQRSADNR